MLEEEGLETVFARHQPPRRGHAPRRSGLGAGDAVPGRPPPLPRPDRRAHARGSFGRRLPGRDPADRFDMSLGSGLGKVADKVFRIGHLGDFNDLMLMGTLSGVEMGLGLAGVPHQKGGVQAAMSWLENSAA